MSDTAPVIKMCGMRHQHTTDKDICPTQIGRKYSCGCFVKVADDSPMPTKCPECGSYLTGMEPVLCDLTLEPLANYVHL